MKEIGNKICEALDLSQTAWDVRSSVYTALRHIEESLLSAEPKEPCDNINLKLEEILSSLERNDDSSQNELAELFKKEYVVAINMNDEWIHQIYKIRKLYLGS